jgi:hypothetical protein
VVFLVLLVGLARWGGGEAAGAGAAVVLAVPLQLHGGAGGRPTRRHALEVGHLQRLGRGDVRAIVARAGLSVAAELQDPLPRDVHVFFAAGAARRASASAKWALRSSLHRLSPALARRAFTVHYACLCVRGG